MIAPLARFSPWSPCGATEVRIPREAVGRGAAVARVCLRCRVVSPIERLDPGDGERPGYGDAGAARAAEEEALRQVAELKALLAHREGKARP